jgi:hypothetical protein
MYYLRDIDVFLLGKFQVAKINSDAQSVHSLYKYMRKFRVKDPRIGEEDFYPFSFVYYIFCKHFIPFKLSNGWMKSLGEWTSIFNEEYKIPDCLMPFVP